MTCHDMSSFQSKLHSSRFSLLCSVPGPGRASDRVGNETAAVGESAHKLQQHSEPTLGAPLSMSKLCARAKTFGTLARTVACSLGNVPQAKLVFFEAVKRVLLK